MTLLFGFTLLTACAGPPASASQVDVQATIDLFSFGAYFEFERPFRLTPGRYRVYDRTRGKVLIDNLIVVPGKEIAVRLSGG